MSNKLTVSLIAAAAIAAATGGAFLALRPSTEERFIRACEDVLKERLRSPASYARVDVVGPTRRKAEYDDFMDRQTPEKKKWLDELRARSATARQAEDNRVEFFKAIPHEVITYLIEYDAANAYGTPLRGASDCSIIVQDGVALPPPGPLAEPVLDDFTSFEWTIFQMWKAKSS